MAGIKVTIDKERTYRWTPGAAKRFQKATGINVFDEASLAKVDAKDLDTTMALIWSGLAGEDPTLTLEQVADMIDIPDVPELLNQISAAWGGKKADPLAGMPLSSGTTIT
jgi:hypothetical protein